LGGKKAPNGMTNLKKKDTWNQKNKRKSAKFNGLRPKRRVSFGLREGPPTPTNKNTKGGSSGNPENGKKGPCTPSSKPPKRECQSGPESEKKGEKGGAAQSAGKRKGQKGDQNHRLGVKWEKNIKNYTKGEKKGHFYEEKKKGVGGW